jgi:MFS family permease
VQGFGGAIVSVVVLSLIMIMFTEPAERAKAMGVVGFVLSGGGTAGVLLGGVLTDLLSWHWIFLVNIPVGVAVFVLSIYLCPTVQAPPDRRRLDVGGAVTVTGALMLAVYAIVKGNEEGWTSAHTLGFLGAALGFLIVFLVIEARHPAPLMPLGLFRRRNISVANVVAVLMAAAMFAMFFFSALYLQLVLEYSPLEVGLAFLPSTLVWGAASLLLSDRLVMRYGIKTPILVGLAFFIGGLLLFARAPVDGSFTMDVLLPMLLFGLGGGITFNPLLLAAMSDVEPQDAGLASGIVNTAFMMGGALGLAVLASIATSRTDNQLASGDGTAAALTSGYHFAFVTGAVFAGIAVLGTLLLRVRMPAHVPEGATMAPEAGPAPSGSTVSAERGSPKASASAASTSLPIATTKRTPPDTSSMIASRPSLSVGSATATTTKPPSKRNGTARCPRAVRSERRSTARWSRSNLPRSTNSSSSCFATRRARSRSPTRPWRTSSSPRRRPAARAVARAAKRSLDATRPDRTMSSPSGRPRS